MRSKCSGTRVAVTNDNSISCKIIRGSSDSRWRHRVYVNQEGTEKAPPILSDVSTLIVRYLDVRTPVMQCNWFVSLKLRALSWVAR